MKLRIRIDGYRVFVTTVKRTDIGKVIENSNITKYEDKINDEVGYTYHSAHYCQTYGIISDLIFKNYRDICEYDTRLIMAAVDLIKPSGKYE